MTAVRRIVPRGEVLALLGVFVALSAFWFRVGIQGDGVSYFSYLPAWFRGSTELGPEFQAFLSAHTPVYVSQVTTVTSIGHHEDLFSVGPAVLSLPAYAVARLGGLLLGADVSQATWLPGIIAYNLTSLMIAFAGLLISYRIAARFVPPGAALAGTLVCWLAGPMMFYSYLQTDYSHTFSMFAVALFVLVTLATTGEDPWWRWLVLGGLAGLMAIVRWQDAVYALLAAIALARGLTAARVPARLLRGVLFLAAALIVALPQLLTTHAIFGYWFPHLPPDVAMDPAHAQVLPTLFSSHHGLIAWAPALGASVIGLALMVRRHPWPAIPILVCLAVQLFVNASLTDWWQGVAFGGRRFAGAYPFFILGLAYLVAWLPRRTRSLQAAVGGALVLWNVLLVAQFRYIQNGDVDLGYSGLISAQREALRYVPRLFGQGSVVHGVFSGLTTPDAGLLLSSLLLIAVVVTASLGLAAALSPGDRPREFAG